MRSPAVAALTFALAACGGSGAADQFAVGNSEITEAQIDAALGPADQASVEDGIALEVAQNGAENIANESAANADSTAASGEDDQ